MAITYNSVDDIDLYSGILSELPATGAVTGPTLNCLLGENFSKIKYSDRYFYELGGQPHSFSSSTELFKKHTNNHICSISLMQRNLLRFAKLVNFIFFFKINVYLYSFFIF